ncbi:MAG: oligopeptide/dipeptide ABC transporter ATP-binding protein [Pseudomonadota bacterium]
MTSLLSVHDLDVTFGVRAADAWPWSKPRILQAVHRVSFDLAEGETLGIVGESGSGKSTLARAVIGTVPAAGGQALWRGKDLLTMTDSARAKARREMAMVFQDPLAALNPRMTVGDIIAEPLVTHRQGLAKAEIRDRVQAGMERVGLLPNQLNRYPHEFSGGQCQRIGIARALITEPKLLICDEPVSALDVSVQAQVVNLLKRLQAEMGLSMVFIAHDLSVVKHISDRIMVMYLGRMMEEAKAKQLIRTPRHPYTRALIAAAPIPDPAAQRGRQQHLLEGELPSPLAPPSGCVFRTRCPIARASCGQDVPVLETVGPGHRAACPWTEETVAA